MAAEPAGRGSVLQRTFRSTVGVIVLSVAFVLTGAAIAFPPSLSFASPAAAVGKTTSVPIPLGKACEWAYPGLASGNVSGTGYSLVCLGKKRQVLGGFSKSHSLSAWCANSRHTGGRHLPIPALVKHVWECTAQAASRPGPSNGPVPIPLGKACEWAYPGQSNGAYSGNAYSIVCLGTNGQVLGGFGGAHSLTAWCADSSHTDGRRLPDATLLKGIWVCAA